MMEQLADKRIQREREAADLVDEEEDSEEEGSEGEDEYDDEDECVSVPLALVGGGEDCFANSALPLSQ